MTSSPCVKLCIMSEAAGICRGCGRTLIEIGRWSQMDEAQRLQIMQDLPKRLEQAEQKPR